MIKSGFDKKLRRSFLTTVYLLEEVKKLRVCGTDDGVMTFEEFLAFVDGRTPLLIEIKQQRDGAKSGIEEKTVKLLDSYKGEFAIQSFDPFIMRRVRLLRPIFLLL